MDLRILHMLESAATAPAQFYLASLWQGLLLASLAWLGLAAAAPLANRRERHSGIAPRTRFLLWMIVLVLSVVVPLAAFAPALLDAGARHAGGAGLASTAANGLPAAPVIPAVWALIIAASWAVASLACLARLAANGWRLRVLARRSIAFSPAQVAPELRTLIVGRSRPIELRLSRHIDAPVAAGFFHPAILIPDWLAPKLTAAELAQIVRHELAHLERRDDWTNLLQKILRALFPLNPALLWADWQLCREREMACDDAVLAGEIAPREYAICLASLAEKRLLRNLQPLAPGAWRRRSELTVRVHRILKHKAALAPLRRRPLAWPLVSGFLLVYLGAGLALARCPRLIHFAPVTAPPVASAASSQSPAAPNLQPSARLVRAALALPQPLQPSARSRSAFMPAASSDVGGSGAGVLSTPRISTRAPAPGTTSGPSASRSGPSAGRLQPLSAQSAASESNRQTHSRQRAPQLVNARYARRAKAAARKGAGQMQVVFTVWEIGPAAPPALPPGTVLAPGFIAVAPSGFAAAASPAGWIVFQL